MNQPQTIGVGVGVMILKGDQVLLGLRNSDRLKADSSLGGQSTWTMPGGKMIYNESFEEAAVREVLEETGLKISTPRIICVNNDKNELAHFITVGLLAEVFKGEPHAMEPDEITEWQWYPLDRLPENMYFPSAKIIDNYNKKSFYLIENNHESSNK